MIEIHEDKIRKWDMSFLDDYFNRLGHIHNAFSENFPSIEHYKLLACLSSQLNDVLILDLGTNEGVSAVCLAQNPTNQVRSYDIKNLKKSEYNKGTIELPNLVFRIKDVKDISDNTLSSAALIFVDLAHNGFDEQNLSDRLTKLGWAGLLLCDDIRSFPPVRHWFINLHYKKYDITEVGHYSGTGIVDFSRPLV